MDLGFGKDEIASTLEDFGIIPDPDTLWPRKSSSHLSKTHLSTRNISPYSFNRDKISRI